MDIIINDIYKNNGSKEEVLIKCILKIIQNTYK
jgi:hypothetical protein